MKKRIFVFLVAFIILFNFNILNVKAEIEVNSGTQTQDTSEACTGTICANTITNYFGLYVQVCKFNSTTNKFSGCTNKKITNKDFTFTKPKNCVTLENGGELNYCWSEYFNQITEKEVNRLLKKVNSKFNTENKSDYYMVIQPLVGIKMTIKSSYSSYLAGDTTFKGTAREVVSAMYKAGDYVAEATDANLKKAATNLGRDFVIKRQDGLVFRDDKWQRAKYIGGMWNVLRNYFTTFKLNASFGPYQTIYSATDLNNMTAYNFTNKDNYNSNIYGKVIVKIADHYTPTITCDLNVNNHTGDNKKYNWTEAYPCEWDNTQTCWRKVENGCCDTYNSKKISAASVNALYPECASCEVEKKVYLDDDSLKGLNMLSCGDAPVKITNSKIVKSGNEVNTNICLTNSQMLTGVINGIRYGCAIKDELNLPEKHKNDVSVGGYFAWPTSKTLQKFEYFDLNYPINRTTDYYCVVYKYDKDGKITYYSINDNEVNTIVKSLSVGGNLNLTYEEKYNGNIVKESTNVISSKNQANFSATINNTYTLDTNNISGTYAYYDKAKDEYTNSITQNSGQFVKYGFPIIPLGKFNDKSATANYGLILQNIGVTGMDTYSCNTYKCNKSGTKTRDYCKCPSGTKKAGVIIDYNISAGSAQCAALQATKCDDAPIKCPDGTDITDCVKYNREGAVTPQTAYGACYARYCEIPPPPPPSTPITDRIIYRTIFLNNPFLNSDGSLRNPGSNWGGDYSAEVISKYITGTAKKMYKGTPMYTITLTASSIRSIREYNNNNGYDNFTLKCDNFDGRCYSSFIHDNDAFAVSGTCGKYTNNNIQIFMDNFDSCRVESINSGN